MVSIFQTCTHDFFTVFDETLDAGYSSDKRQQGNGNNMQIAAMRITQILSADRQLLNTVDEMNEINQNA